MVRKKLVFGIIFFLSLNLRSFGAQIGNFDSSAGTVASDIESGAGSRGRTGSELRHRTRSSSERGDSKGSGSEVEITPPSRAVPKLRDLLPSASDIHQELVRNWQALKDGKVANYDQLGNLVEKFTDPRARKHFPVLIPYGIAGGSSFAIYAVQTKQPEALKFLAQIEDFMAPDQLHRTPMSVALELAVKDASYSAVITVLEELQAARGK